MHANGMLSWIEEGHRRQYLKRFDRIIGEYGDFKISIRCLGSYSSFKFMKAQSGDYKVTALLQGPGIRIKVGSWLRPINMGGGGGGSQLHGELDRKCKKKYGISLPDDAYRALEEAVRPY